MNTVGPRIYAMSNEIIETLAEGVTNDSGAKFGLSYNARRCAERPACTMLEALSCCMFRSLVLASMGNGEPEHLLLVTTPKGVPLGSGQSHTINGTRVTLALRAQCTEGVWSTMAPGNRLEVLRGAARHAAVFDTPQAACEHFEKHSNHSQYVHCQQADLALKDGLSKKLEADPTYLGEQPGTVVGTFGAKPKELSAFERTLRASLLQV